MANNTQLNLGAGGDLIATHDFGSFKGVQGITGYLAANGLSIVDVTPSTPLPVTAVITGGVNATVTGTVAVSNFPATQPVSASALPLPSGAATAAKQPTLGTAGAASSDVLTVQGAASMTALKVDGSAVNQPVILGAGSAIAGVVISPQQTGAIYSGTTALTPKFAMISASASGSTNVVALVASKKLRVLRWTVSGSAAVNAKFVSNGGSPTDLTGLFYGPAAGPINGGSYAPVGHFETVAGEPLAINLSAAVPVGGVLTYIEV